MDDLRRIIDEYSRPPRPDDMVRALEQLPPVGMVLLHAGDGTVVRLPRCTIVEQKLPEYLREEMEEEPYLITAALTTTDGCVHAPMVSGPDLVRIVAYYCYHWANGHGLSAEVPKLGIEGPQPVLREPLCDEFDDALIPSTSVQDVDKLLAAADCLGCLGLAHVCSFRVAQRVVTLQQPPGRA